ncbi:MAG: hypothetical protein KC912_07795 [Proteobacteria bacterium]|nr:hypothetical protein [Pseudomonadota bacterium]
MATWSELLGACAPLHGFEQTSENEFQVLVQLRGERGEDRAQRCWVRRFDAWGESMLEVRSAFASSVELSAGDALCRNLDLPIGAIARHGEVLVLVHKLPLEPISIEGVLFVVEHVSMVADTLEAKRGTDRF